MTDLRRVAWRLLACVFIGAAVPGITLATEIPCNKSGESTVGSDRAWLVWLGRCVNKNGVGRGAVFSEIAGQVRSVSLREFAEDGSQVPGSGGRVARDLRTGEITFSFQEMPEWARDFVSAAAGSRPTAQHKAQARAALADAARQPMSAIKSGAVPRGSRELGVEQVTTVSQYERPPQIAWVSNAAAKTGFRKGDLVVALGSVEAPTTAQFFALMWGSADRTLPATVLRDGAKVGLSLPVRVEGHQPGPCLVVGTRASDNPTYSGECQDGLAHGKGRFTASGREPDGAIWTVTYTGEFRSGFMHGQGARNQRTEFPDGSTKQLVTEGEFMYGLAHGTAVRVLADRTSAGQITNSTTKGQFADNLPHGVAVQDFKGGEIEWRYEGTFIKGERTGRGVQSDARGDRYEGEFEAGHRHGRGTYLYANGDRYQGPWTMGKQHGEGTFFEAASSESFTTAWVDGHSADLVAAMKYKADQRAFAQEMAELTERQNREAAREEAQAKREMWGAFMGGLQTIARAAETRPAPVWTPPATVRQEPAPVRTAPAMARQESAPAWTPTPTARPESAPVSVSPGFGHAATAPPQTGTSQVNPNAGARPNQRASTENDPRTCVTSPAPGRDPICKDGTARKVTNNCDQAVAVRMCMRNPTSWDCRVEWNVQPGGSWSNSWCRGNGDTFWDARSANSDRPLRSP